MRPNVSVRMKEFKWIYMLFRSGICVCVSVLTSDRAFFAHGGNVACDARMDNACGLIRLKIKGTSVRIIIVIRIRICYFFTTKIERTSKAKQAFGLERGEGCSVAHPISSGIPRSGWR